MTWGLSYEHCVIQLKNYQSVGSDGEFGAGWRRAACDPEGLREDGVLC